MKKRIGNDISFVWHIYRKDGDTQVPESFADKDVEVKLISPLQRPVTIEDVSIATGVVTFTFRGKHQVTLGNYVAVLQENRGEDGMVTLDVVNAVTLVPHSYMEEDGDEGDVIEAEAVELESSISAGSGGGIEQQQADWAQTDDTAVDFIKNKPNLDVYCRKDATNVHTGGYDQYIKDFGESVGNVAIDAQQLWVRLLYPNGELVSETRVGPGNIRIAKNGITLNLNPAYFQTLAETMQNKVDKVTGKGLSTNDYTDAEKTKLAGLENYDDTAVRELIAGKQDTINDLTTIRSGAQAGATAYQKPSTGIPATDLASDVQSDIAAIDTIEEVIPEQASSSNQLADKGFVNSSIATATATYRDSYNLVSDLSLTVSATQQQIADALASKMAALSITPDNNDYCFVQIPTADATPTEIARIDRYKYNGTAWAYEYSLNNSSFTAAQWAALNSGITSGLVAKLFALPTNSELATLLNGKADTADLAEVATSGSYNDLTDRPTVDNTPTPNSNNLVKSGGVYSTTPSITDTDAESDLDISDEDGNVLMRLSDGHIKTKNFNSELYARIISGVDYDSEVVPVTDANAILSYKQHKSIGSFDFDFKWVGACMAANGRIYGITNGNRQVLEINPETDTYCLFGNLSSGSFKWSGCGIGKNGMIYGYPRSANSVLIIDPVTQGVEEVDLGTNYEQNHHYGGCIVGDYMYLAPRTANHILKINLRTWQIERLGENILTDIARYSACIYHPNGYIYFIPESNAKVLKLNPLNDAITELGSVLQSSCSVYGASVAPSNKCIYGFTGNRTNGGILKIDVENNDTISFIHEGTVGTGYYSTELALNGKLYSGVGNGTTVWELDPNNDSVSIVDTISDTEGGDYNEAKCAGGVLAENGSIYLIPAKGRHIYKLEFDGQVVRTISRKVLMSNYFSNY